MNTSRLLRQLSWWYVQLSVAFLAGASIATPALAQCLPDELQKVTASDARRGELYGISVQILGDLAISGAAWAHVENHRAGAVYSYRKDPNTNQWIQEQKIFPEDLGPLDWFGRSVDINPVDQNVIIIGAWANDDAEDCGGSACESGSAYIFRFDTDLGLWVQEQKLTASDADPQDYFGWAVSIYGDVAIIGAKLDENSGQGSGSAYIFQYDHDSGIWNEQQKLIPPDPSGFGHSISLYEDVVLIGSPFEDEFGYGTGAVYSYRMDPDSKVWQLEQRIIAEDASQEDFFGYSVSLDGNTALISAFRADGAVNQTGAAYIFTYGGQQWTQRHKLFSSDGGPFDQFGLSVSLNGNMAVVAANLNDVGEIYHGSAYIFTFDSEQWNETAKLIGSDLQLYDTFGTAADTDGQNIIIGAIYYDSECNVWEHCDSGAAYIYGGLDDCNTNGIMDICDIANGKSTDKNNNGLPDECDPPACPWDLDNSGSVGASDLIALFAQWGTTGSADFNSDGIVNTADLLILFANWGPCE